MKNKNLNRKIECMILVLLLFCISHLIAEPCGDVNSSNEIDIIDALLTAQYYVGLDPENFDLNAADVNADSNIDILDALLIAQYYVELITGLPGCEVQEPTPDPGTEELKAFPAAEGYGRYATGGRGGRVIEVTNLNDSGSGSLRDAIGQSGARTIMFRVSGTIEMNSDMEISNSNITIAGQTAPGDGICLKDFKFVIAADDVIVRHLRLRRGRESGDSDDTLSIEGGAENVVVDHCSISWGCDETLNTWHGSSNITVQWCIISEGLHHNNHGFAASIGGVNATYHHLLIAHCPGRNPSLAGNNEHQTINLDFRNCVIFNFGYRTIDGKPTSVNIVNNYFKPGPNSTVDYFASIDKPGVYEKIPTTSWYVAGNTWEGNEAITDDNHAGCTGATDWLVDTPNPFAPVNTETAEDAYQSVLEYAGATLPRRDSVDTRIIQEVSTGQTTYGDGVVNDPSDVGGWPQLISSPAPEDTDHDGMPNQWEIEHNLDPSNQNDANGTDLSAVGYTNLEMYLNELAGDSVIFQ